MCIDNCNNKIYKKGYCRKHYDILNKQGKIEITTEEIQERINKYDKDIIYLSGYINCHSIIRCKCNRCENIFERRYENITRHNTEYSCPICQTKLGLKKSKKNANPHIIPVSEREQQFIETLLITKPTYTYVSGYTNAKGNVLVKCNKCGYKMQYSVDRLTRKNKNIACKNCLLLQRKKQKEQKAKANDMLKRQAKHIYDIKLNKRKEIERIYKKFKKNTLYVQKCVVCNEEYVGHSQSKYCPMCRKKVSHHHSYKSLKRLYDRDNGICHICNELCDWNDKIIDKGTIIVGSNYPSIDPIIPLAKGGTDDWNNLGLAHVRCNLIKKDN